ncbi:MAG: hypothetical protein ACLFUE_00105 [Desulfobacteraceae bacterium]
MLHYPGLLVGSSSYQHAQTIRRLPLIIPAGTRVPTDGQEHTHHPAALLAPAASAFSTVCRTDLNIGMPVLLPSSSPPASLPSRSESITESTR